MHVVIILISLALSWGIRLATPEFTGTWHQRWQKALFFFLLPPLLLLMSTLAILVMGASGHMLGLHASWWGFDLALGFVLCALGLAIKHTHEARQSWQQLSLYPQKQIGNQWVRILAFSLPYSAQIGFWQPELVISQGLLDSLDEEHLEAVLAHEKAHQHYRDTFWFFWLGWLRSLTSWLPCTQTLWQELLLLREMRADRQAIQKVDPLVLAESLLTVAKAPLTPPQSFSSFCVPLYSPMESNRLSQRIDAIFGDCQDSNCSKNWSWFWLLLAFLPWLTVPFHY